MAQAEPLARFEQVAGEVVRKRSLLRGPQRRRKDQFADVEPARHHAGSVGEPIPLDREWPDAQRDRVDVREFERQHTKHMGSLSSRALLREHHFVIAE